MRDLARAIYRHDPSAFAMLAVFPVLWVFAALLDSIWPTPVFGV